MSTNLYQTKVEDKLVLIEGWARDGLSDADICAKLSISRSTFFRYKKRYPKFEEALLKGREGVDYAVENALLKKALSGDNTAMMFWLKNRKPQKWSDKPKEAGNGQDKVVIIDDIPETERTDRREIGQREQIRRDPIGE